MVPPDPIAFQPKPSPTNDESMMNKSMTSFNYLTLRGWVSHRSAYLHLGHKLYHVGWHIFFTYKELARIPSRTLRISPCKKISVIAPYYVSSN